VNDEWTLKDYLNHNQHVKTVANFIRECNPPYVLGIHGDWGTGKTSFLHKLHLFLAHEDSGYKKWDEEFVSLFPGEPLEKPEDIETIWFDAWRYQFEANPVIALLNEIRTHFTWTKKLAGEAAKLGYAALMSIEEVTKKIGIKASSIASGGEKWEKDHLYQPLPSQLCRDLLDDAISKLLDSVEDNPKKRKGRTKKNKGKPKKRLVIFVDDLDRCEGSVAFRFIEAMKIYLSIPSCVFVIGLDHRHVNKAVANELLKNGMIPESERTSAELYAMDYLSKMFQSWYYLPSMANRRKFLNQFLDDDIFNGKEEDQSKGSDELLDLIEKHKVLPPNPRKIKKFATGLNIYWQQVKEKLNGQEPDRKLALIIIYLKLMANNIYRILEEEQDFWLFILDFCENNVGKELHPAFKMYRLPKYEMEDASPRVSVFPDPADEKTFRIGSLIKEYRDGQRPKDDEFKIYLLK
jgi:hypothetical protein